MDEPRRRDFGSLPDDFGSGSDVERDPAPQGSVPDELEVERRWMHRVQVDPEKFEYFYRKYRPRVFRYAFLNVGDHDLASDITSETFSQAADNLGKFRWQGRSFGAWLFRIARNALLMEVRRRNIRLEIRYVPEFHDRADGNRPDNDLDRSEDTRHLMDAMGKLRDIRREVLLHKYGLGLTTREIAGVLDMPEATVKSHLQRGRTELLDLLTNMGVERPLSDRGRHAVLKAVAADRGWGVVNDDTDRPE
jgi:RNA polymerase sigma-70 factor (ECF subfamily)